MKVSLKTAAPIAIFAFGGIAGLGLVTARPHLDTEKPDRRSPLVRVVRAVEKDTEIRIHAQGTVVPRTETDLVAEVGGRIIEVSPSLVSGGFLEEGEVLLRIDPSDYEIALERAKAAYARAESSLELARATLKRQEQLAQRKVGSSADVDGARNRKQLAEADLRDARAARSQALRNLERTAVRVPFAGRVRRKMVDIGQYVGRGTKVARVYSVDYAEVRLPIPDRDAAFVDLPIGYRGEKQRAGTEAGGPSPEVVLRAHFAGREYTWNGRIVRTEGELDPKTRMIHAVARVKDPYGRGDNPDRPPLAVGLFVDAEIAGRVMPNTVRLPRSALRGNNQVAIIDSDDRIELRTVAVLRHDRTHVLVSEGIAAGERVVIGSLAIAVEGMQVRVFEERAEPSELASPADSDGLAPRATNELGAARETGL